MTMSRRNVLPVLTVAATVPLLLPLVAEAKWNEYHSDNLGFRVELPGGLMLLELTLLELTAIQELKVESGGPAMLEDLNEKKDLLIRISAVDADREQIQMAVYRVEYKKPVSPEEEFATLRQNLRKRGVPPPREAALTIYGFPAREFVCEADDDKNLIHRRIVMGRLTFRVGVSGKRQIHDSPITRRFFDSFKLLRSAS